MLRVHFFNVDPSRRVIPLAAALGVGQAPEAQGADVRRFERLFDEAPRRFAVASPEEADVHLNPHGYGADASTRDALLAARALGKPAAQFHLMDDTAPTEAAHGLVWRESLLASQRMPHERVLPAFADDLLREVGGMRLRPKRPTPVVGFCGYVGSAWRRALYRAQGRQRKVLGLTLRSKALAALERSDRVATNFVRRTQFWGGAIGRLRGEDPEAKRRVREEYLSNLIECDYVLCLRGAGNFSYRFYETLAVGRTPLLVNTDCQMPFGDALDWRRHVAWVEQEDLPRIADRVAEFHAALSDEDFERLQHDSRRLWEEHLRPTECYERVLRATIDAGC